MPVRTLVRGSLKIELLFDRASLTVRSTPFGLLLGMEGCRPGGEPGGPSLPSKVIYVALPPGAQPEAVAAEVLEKVVVAEAPAFPAPVERPRPMPMSTLVERMRHLRERLSAVPADRPPSPPAVAPSDALYSRELEEGRPVAVLQGVRECGPNSIALVRVNPVQLNGQGQTELLTRIALEVTYRRPRARRMPRTEMRPQALDMSEFYRSRVVNPEQLEDVSKRMLAYVPAVDYLIVTDNRRWNADTMTASTAVAGDMVAQFQRLADWKQRRGLKPRVVTVSDIVTGAHGDFRTGARDLQEVIRNFLKYSLAQWGARWVLLGGDVDVIPVRKAVACSGWIGWTTKDPPDQYCLFWTGSYTKFSYPGRQPTVPLLNLDNGKLIPYDAAGASGPTQPGWYFTTDDTYSNRSATPTPFLRINGPAANVEWIEDGNNIPTDLYYASLTGPGYGVGGRHDWDLTDKGYYGTYNADTDHDGVKYDADVLVGRAPVASEAEASAFVAKVIAYESFRRPDGTLLDENWPRKILLAAANFNWRVSVTQGAASPPADQKYVTLSGRGCTLLNTQFELPLQEWQLLIQVTEDDVRAAHYRRDASPSVRGWYFARSATNLSPSEKKIKHFVLMPVKTRWIVFYGPPAELTPQSYVFDFIGADVTMKEQELVRQEVQTELRGMDNVWRLYEDDIDLEPGERAAAPVEHLTETHMRAKINEGQNLVAMAGHGSSGGCCTYSIDIASNATNGCHTYIAYADSCLTNAFDVDDAVSERSLQNANGGAVAYIGNSRNGWDNVGDLKREFFRRLATTRHLGLAAATRFAVLDQHAGSIRREYKWSIYSLNLMGDPEMPVWVGPPKDMQARYGGSPAGRTTLLVSVTEPGLPRDAEPIRGAVVTVRQGSFVGQAVTNSKGAAAVDLDGTAPGKIEVTVSRIDYLPIIDTIDRPGPT